MPRQPRLVVVGGAGNYYGAGGGGGYGGGGGASVYDGEANGAGGGGGYLNSPIVGWFFKIIPGAYHESNGSVIVSWE